MMEFVDPWPTVELLLCASDLAQRGYSAPITEAAFGLDLSITGQEFADACDWLREVRDEPPYWTNEGLYLQLLEAAYRCSESFA